MSAQKTQLLRRTQSIHDKEDLLRNYIMNGGPILSYEVIKASGWGVLRDAYWKNRRELNSDQLKRCGNIDDIYINKKQPFYADSRETPQQANIRYAEYLKSIPIGLPTPNTSLAKRSTSPFKFQSLSYKSKKSIRKSKKSARKSVRKSKKSAKKTKK
jgi:hypothetical protein